MMLRSDIFFVALNTISLMSLDPQLQLVPELLVANWMQITTYTRNVPIIYNRINTIEFSLNGRLGHLTNMSNLLNTIQTGGSL